MLLIAVMCVIYAWQMIVGWEGYYPFMAVPAEITRSWQNVREGSFSGRDLTTFGTMLSCAFLHGDPAHIVYNMLFFWLFAALAAELLGSSWMLVIFFFTALTGSLCHVLFNAQDATPMLGASGAVMGFEGAYLGLAVRWKLPDPHIFPLARPIPPAHLAALAVIGIAIDWTSIMNQSQTNVAYGAHLGGFIGGIFLTSFLAQKPKLAEVR